VGAKRVVLDTIETLFGWFEDENQLRKELRRLFGWLKERGVTAIITGERGDGALTRHSIEEYVSDCVIVLDHRVSEQTSTRRLRVLKYRGSLHGTNEYPFLIGAHGVSVLPITSLGLQHTVSTERVSSGMPDLDGMLGGEGFYRGSSILISGTAGTGKSTLAAQFCAAACARGERALYFAFEESAAQIVRKHGLGRHRPRLLRRGGATEVPLHPPQPAGPGGAPGVHAGRGVALRARRGRDGPHLRPAPRRRGLEVSAMLTRQVDYLKSRGHRAVHQPQDGGGADNSESGSAR
jgi:circadian clock protein KaiC